MPSQPLRPMVGCSLAKTGQRSKHLGLSHDADRKAIRSAYSHLVRKYHPDKNGGDRSHEKALQDVIAAYTHLRKAQIAA